MVLDRQAEEESSFRRQRQRMVADQIVRRGVRDQRVLEAMRRVPRHRFVPEEFVAEAYTDHPLPIGYGQTISQPYIVAYMIAALALERGARVLEVGTGSGYQAAVLAEMGYDVFTIEVRSVLATRAGRTLQALGYEGISVRCADGLLGWPEGAPFDGIIAAAAPWTVPDALLNQLAPGGCLVIPVGDEQQTLFRYRRTDDGISREELLAVRFVPMTGGK